MIAAAKAEIEQEVSRAKDTLRAQVAVLAVQGAEKILRREVDAKAHADLLNAVAASSETSSHANSMAELVTIARPYAAAAFSHAKAKGQLAQWSDMLALLVSIYQDAQMQEVLHNPQLDQGRHPAHVPGRLRRTRSTTLARNLLVLLVENNRLNVLPAIRDLFEQLKANYENEVDAQIESAFPLSEDQVRVLVQQAGGAHRAQGKGQRDASSRS